MVGLTGQKFGRLEVKVSVGRDKGRDSLWVCFCDCGGTTTVKGNNLKNGNTQSCGCLQREQMSKAKTTHGHCKNRLHTKEYNNWQAKMQRCYNPKHKYYKDYGGRGIKVCEQWHTFENFYADVGDIPKGMTLDRIDNDGDYEPENWRFATQGEQMNNTRRNVHITYNGETKTVTQWAKDLNMSAATLRYRLIAPGWTTELALTTPVRKSNAY